ncbi:MAG TPA: hypothetical protein VMN39_04695, partial [Longimicrobiaceae bacterium]|nr:hypothetical protein [Longimicrobiaceae bacterium]
MQTLNRLACVVALAFASAGATAAQDLAATADAGPRVSREDSLGLLRAARSDQAAFERLRR